MSSPLLLGVGGGESGEPDRGLITINNEKAAGPSGARRLASRPAARRAGLHPHCPPTPPAPPALAGLNTNPLFGGPSLLSPSPPGVGPGAFNPAWSPTLGSGLPASSALGLRRLGALPPSQLGAAAAAGRAGEQDGGDGSPPLQPAPELALGAGERWHEAGPLPPPPPAASASLGFGGGRSPRQQQQQQQQQPRSPPILPTSPGVPLGGLALPRGGPAALVAGRDRPEEQAFAETLGAVRLRAVLYSAAS